MSIVEKAIKKLEGEGAKQPAAEKRGDLPPALPPAGGATGPSLSLAESRKRLKQTRGPLQIDLPRLREVGLLPPEDMERQLANEYRRVKRPLLDNAFGRNASSVQDGNLVMISSALPGAGKTFTSMNLALSMSLERDRTVLLVDADVAKPHITHELGMAERPGLIDLLMDDGIDLGDVLVGTSVNGLVFLPAGASHPEATELLASEKMDRMIHEIANRYPDRIIIFDSPPLLMTSESQVLAGHMGQLVVVVQAGVTQQQLLTQALDTLDLSRPVYLVLNKSRSSGADTYYGGYYGYSG